MVKILTNNGIEDNQANMYFYRAVLLGVFEVIYKTMSNSNEIRLEIKDRIRNNVDKKRVVKNIVEEIVSCKIEEQESELLLDWISAYFRKKDKRKLIDDKDKQDLLVIQKCKCSICGVSLSISNSHLDHIVPFKYVGDELQNNYQILCQKCNLRKNAKTYFELSNLLVKKI